MHLITLCKHSFTLQLHLIAHVHASCKLLMHQKTSLVFFNRLKKSNPMQRAVNYTMHFMITL